MIGKKKASVTANIPAMQIPPQGKKYLQQRISQFCRYCNIKKITSDYAIWRIGVGHARPKLSRERSRLLLNLVSGSAFAKPHHSSNTLLTCSTGKFKSSASLSTSVIDLDKVLINSSVTRFVTFSVTRFVTSSSCS